MTAVNRDQKLYDGLLDLKRHLRSCRQCVVAKKTRTPKDMCDQGLSLTLEAAMRYDDIIKMKVAAHNHPGNVIYACPDTRLHGKSYALTAQAFIVTALQPSLF